MKGSRVSDRPPASKTGSPPPARRVAGDPRPRFTPSPDLDLARILHEGSTVWPHDRIEFSGLGWI